MSPFRSHTRTEVAGLVAVVLLSFVTFACSEPLDFPDPRIAVPEGTDVQEWSGTVTTEGNVTTVVNESGSVWGGKARLVEEVAIGVEAGPDEYMFGSITAVYATEERIYVVDRQVPAVRMYDVDGTFIGNLGGPGRGPGEYVEPYAIVGDADGRIFLSDDHGHRVNVYGSDGTPLVTWAVDTVDWPMVPAGDVELWLPIFQETGRREGRYGIELLRDGVASERWLLETFAGEALPGRPGPAHPWIPLAPARIVVGTADRYRYEVQERGVPVLVVERRVEPTTIDPEHAEWYRRVQGGDAPNPLPAISGFIAATSGELWVTRIGPGRRMPACEEDLSDIEAARNAPCWRLSYILDVFDAGGRYLGEVDFPQEVRPFFLTLFARDDLVVTATRDDLGTARVKRFRLVLPGETADVSWHGRRRAFGDVFAATHSPSELTR